MNKLLIDIFDTIHNYFVTICYNIDVFIRRYLIRTIISDDFIFETKLFLT